MCLAGTVCLTALNLASSLSLELEHPHSFAVAETVFTGCPSSAYLLASRLCALWLCQGDEVVWEILLKANTSFKIHIKSDTGKKMVAF